MGGPVVEQLQRDGLRVKPFMTTNASKSEAVEALALAFERGEIRIPNDAVLIGELQAFESKPLPSGIMRYDAPSGGHDDTVMALAIAWQGVADSRKRHFNADYAKVFAEANAGLTRSGSGWGDDRVPSDYPEGGNSVWSGQSPFNPSRWSH
jgi:hypothetical protein